ncbi:MAG TPA: hypothetical protein VN515_09995 [Terriglobales bacterium]|nr:hypothetical protein [Terriglobales bacterium]
MPFVLILVAVAVLVGLYFVYDRRRYRGRSTAGQVPTGEVFRDPVSGRRTRVYEDPRTGAREYRPEDPEDPPGA